MRIPVNHFLAAPSTVGLRPHGRSCSSRQDASTVVLRFLRFVRVRRQLLSTSCQQAWTEAPPAVDCWMAVRSSTTCGYDSHAISVDVRYWTIVYDRLTMLSEPESVRARELIIDQHAFASGTESSGPCRLWLIVGYFHPGSVKESRVYALDNLSVLAQCTYEDSTSRPVPVGAERKPRRADTSVSCATPAARALRGPRRFLVAGLS